MKISLRKNLGAFALEVELKVEEGELLALTGASGAGKTMLLRCVAGLEKPDSGTINFHDESWYDSARGICLPAQQRRAGFMFQDYALFPNMTVRGNLEFAQRKGASRKRVDDLLEMMALGDLQHSKPATLSGGQKQRAALARALAAEPRLLLLDEPLSALDRETRLRLQDEILAMHRQFGLTTLIVSHDVSEIYKLARRVAVLESGHITREGAPADVFGAGHEGGKFRFAGEVLAIEQADVVFAVSILVGNQIVRIIATPDEAAQLKIGSRIMLLSKAFNPMLQVV
ncbi:MAG: ATP-binding cassette domain-containing protein [Methylobacillus sp.]|jgi:molybdate transport system ATP-binding protein|nr:ATP-binding cassette domain-containing protein [Methylobacillus sp.]